MICIICNVKHLISPSLELARLKRKFKLAQLCIYILNYRCTTGTLQKRPTREPNATFQLTGGDLKVLLITSKSTVDAACSC